MKITFWGAARTVTGSQHLIDIAGERVLLDCGLYQGRRDDANSINQTFPFDPASLQAMVLSHAHIDHSGNIPNLVKQGFTGPIHATFATEDICQAMLMDSAKIQEEDPAPDTAHRRAPAESPRNHGWCAASPWP